MEKCQYGVEINIEEVQRKYEGELKGVISLQKGKIVREWEIYHLLYSRFRKKDHIKDRLLGHWGTCPGINLVYANCNLLIKEFGLNMFLVVGPGHGAPAILANLYLEGTLLKYYPSFTMDYSGIKQLIKGFSWPGGFPSHINAEYPGCIHEGGELGYALAVAWGAVMDNPNLIVTCIIGDGECETGPTATAWHSHKFIDYSESGGVIPIIHLNGYKISSETIYGVMSNLELYNLFTGFGYQVAFVEYTNENEINANLYGALEWAYKQIKKIQEEARNKKEEIVKPQWPLIILRTPKGLSGIKELHGEKIEGNYKSHGIPAQNVKTDDEEFNALNNWLLSYNVSSFFNEKGEVKSEIINNYPEPNKRMGVNPHTLPTVENECLKPLILPDINKYTKKLELNKERGSLMSSITEIGGCYLADLIKLNPNNFRVFSPDELTSNKLTKILSVTNRNNQWNKETANKDGRVIEILSEHTCQGWMQGYTLTGRYALFPSYETFLGIITTMMIQYAKFIKLGKEHSWRPQVPSINYIETSTLWRQEHNGYSHQDPMFINNLINIKSNQARIYFPPDANTFLFIMEHCLKLKNTINLIVGTKQKLPILFNQEEAKEIVIAGIGICKWLSPNEESITDPDVVLVGCGNETNMEVVAASYLLKRDLPQLKFRVVNVIDIMVLTTNRNYPYSLSTQEFNGIFTKDKPVIFNFHGYPSVIYQLLFGRENTSRFEISGYIEEGSTTTPFKMLTVNRASRFHVCIAALEAAAKQSNKIGIDVRKIISKYRNLLEEHDAYILENGSDPKYISDFFLTETN